MCDFAASFYERFAGNLRDDLHSAHLQPASGITMFTPSPSNASSYSVDSPSSADDEGFDTTQGYPYLEIEEQPVPSFRFRYRSEMQGAHGSLLGRGSESSRKKCYPTVKLHNFSGDAIIRCSLYSADSNPIPHIHQMITRKSNKDVYDHELPVSDRNNYTAEFRGLGIVHVSKKNLKDELVRKKELKLFEELKSDESLGLIPDSDIKAEVASRRKQIEAEAEKDAKLVDPNRVKLCFEAFVRDQRGRVKYLCNKVFSTLIQNMKSAETCELKICRMDKYMGSCRGGDEVYILVEKVCKKNIKVRFYEEDDSGNEVWQDFATFRDYDVHHQYAIVFRTPAYCRDDIQQKVNVKVQLFRPNNNQFSNSLPFVYKPARQYMKKRRCESSTTSSSFSSIEAKKYCQPSSVEQGEMVSDQDPLLSGEFSSLGSYPSDALQQALTQFVKNTSNTGTEDLDELLNFASSVDFEGYLDMEPSRVEPVTDLPVLLSLDPDLDKIYLDKATSRKQNIHSKDCIVVDGPVSKGSKNRVIPKGPQNTDQKSMYFVAKSLDQLQELMLSNDSNRNQEIKQLLKPKNQEMGPLHAAVFHGYLRELGDILSLLIKGGLCKYISMVNHLKETPLILAAKKNKADCVKVLLLAGADVNPSDIDQNSALHWAVKNANCKIVKELLSHKEYDRHSKKIDLDKRNRYGESPLHLALLMDEPEQIKNDVVKLLLSANANPNLIYDDETPLMLAVQQNDSRSVELLIEAGADLNVCGLKENTALHLAVECKHHECIRELLSLKPSAKSKGIELDKKNEQGETPLHKAIRIMDLTSVELLIQAGCDVNAKIPTSGDTPLHLAVQYNSKDILHKLINTKTIRLHDENLSGKTALDLTELDSKQLELSNLLKELSFETVKEEFMSDDEYGDVGPLLIDEDACGEVNGLHIDEDTYSEVINTETSAQKSLKTGKQKNVNLSRRDEYSSSAKSKSSEKDPSVLFDRKTYETVIRCLDRDKKWKLLCQKLNCSFLETNITGVPSPTRCLISYIEFEHKVTVNEFRDAVEEIGATDALKAIDTMIKKGSSVESKRRNQASF